MKSLQKGFTLIELMIVIAILGILMAIAIPAYQDYTVRAKFSECINQLAPLKLGVSEFRISNGRFPGAMTSFADPSTTTYCATPTYNAGVLTATGNISGISPQPAVLLSPTVNATSGDIQWKCKPSAAAKYTPASCR
jgi:type IV pilus assembly protein PilA